MNFSEFNNRVQVITKTRADEIRDRYIRSFIETQSEWYQTKIATKQQFADGLYYTGYLWECLLSFKHISEEESMSWLEEMTQKLFVLWDIHSSEKILIKNYWRFPKSAVLYALPKELAKGLQYLPEDIYIFTDQFDLSLVMTHEHADDGKRLCALAYSVNINSVI